MDTKELEQIIENHRHWLDKDVDGWGVMRADLMNADLGFADLMNANLRNADLMKANLRNADLRNANLGFADLGFADLRDANLRDANLRDANLRFANLSGADLRFADLRSADLRSADLRFANLSGADLRFTDLRDADLGFADLRDANLRDADLSYAKNVPYIPMICPEEGSFIGYKKASGKIIKLCIPEDAKRSSATTRKCRCNKAIVLGIYELDGSISNVTEVHSNYDSNFIYKINKEVVVDNFDNDRWNECSTGIHFFMQRHEAVEYQS